MDRAQRSLLLQSLAWAPENYGEDIAVKPVGEAQALCPGLALSQARPGQAKWYMYKPGPQSRCGSCVPEPCCPLGYWASSCLQACGRN